MWNSTFKWLGRVLLIDAAVALSVPLFRSFFDAGATLGALVHQYLFSVIYANVIGIPLCLLLPLVWVRTAALPSPTKSLARGMVVLLTNFAGCLLAGLILNAILRSTYDYWGDFRHSFGLSLVISAIAVAFVSMYEVQEAKLRVTAMQLKTKELERERALKLATEAKLASLESRIHPHFLFNAINSISALIPEDPYRAERLLTQLADLLRFSLDSAAGGLIALEKELQIIEDYLEIETARFGERLSYRLEVPRDLLAEEVPPLALQTLVENSVKYAVGARKNGANLLIRATADPKRLWLEVVDDGPGFGNVELPSGHGLSNLQERLMALFGTEAKLRIESNTGRTAVALDIPRGALIAASYSLLTAGRHSVTPIRS